MKKYEYKTVTLDQKGLGLFSSRKVPELDETLNDNGNNGWRLHEIVLPSAAFGESDKVIVVFERELPRE